MSFIRESATKILYAYLTPKGREYVLNGNKEDFEITYFSLHDDDTNYKISSNILSGSTYMTLPSGFVPDLTGDIDSCIKSISNSITTREESTLYGSTIFDVNGKTTVGEIGTDREINSRILYVNIPNNTLNLTSLNIQNNIFFNVNLNLPSGETTPISINEIKNSTIRVSLLDTPSNLFSNILINGKPNSNTFTFTGTSISIPISFTKGSTPIGSAIGTIRFKIEPFKSFLNLEKNTSDVTINDKYTITLTITNSGPPTS